ncbi:nucleotidyltransferase family protein [Candidatus Borrarchaeum sp.]|uniref:nucleotidyltransferase family protein n=1 Tax=Candidatus Borrarchaeum sp. TaxID=2846742 RepID=UPI00257A2FDA|nr:nucleotidyltransferase family protein [Candidatus Borrarchaeum sp.]
MKFQRIEDMLLFQTIMDDSKLFVKELETMRKKKNSIDWLYIIECAKRNSIIPQVYIFFDIAKDIQVPKEILEQLRRLYYKYLSYYLTANYTIKEIIKLFNKNNIRFLLIKGHSIDQFYPHSHYRQFLEIDVLVSSVKKFKMACKKLRDFGYRVFPKRQLKEKHLFALNFAKKDRISIDLHKELIWGNHKNCKEELFRNKNIMKIDGSNLFTVSPEANILFICSRLFESGYFLIRDIFDVIRIISYSKDQLKWDHILYSAQKNNLLFPLLCLLYLVHFFYHPDLIPRSVFKQLSRNFFLKLIWALLKKTKIEFPLFWNSSVSKIGLLYGNLLKSKRNLKQFILDVQRSGLSHELRFLLAQRIKQPIAFHYIKEMLIRK